MDKKIQNMVDKLKAIPDGIYVSLHYMISWNFKEELPDACSQPVRDSIDSCAKTNNWPLRRNSSDNMHVLFVVQVDNPDISAENVFLLFQEQLKNSLVQAFPQLNALQLTAEDAVIETVDSSEFESEFE